MSNAAGAAAGASLILASRSASRQQMLAAAGVAFEARDAQVDERALEAEFAGSRPDQIALALAEAKALAVPLAGEEIARPVLAGDSLVMLGADRFDKPASREEAREHLRSFSGRVMQLHSAAAIAREGALAWHHAGLASVQFRPLSEDFIETYLDAEWPAIGQCVGCFRIEGRGAQLFDRIDGDYFTILGMPLLPVLRALRDLDLMAA